MATNACQQKRPDHGVIILGNSGTGKSFLCNILLNKQVYESDYRPTKVTSKTECIEMNIDNSKVKIFNIPGLIENDKNQMEENKKQIMKAFEMCPMSIVLFVWSPNSGGRIDANDAVAFSALYKSYQFPTKSLIYVVNNLKPDRNTNFDATFLTQIQTAVRENCEIELGVEQDVVMINTIDFTKQTERENERVKLLFYILKHFPVHQEKKQDIHLEIEELKKLRDEVKRQQEKAKENEAEFNARIKEMEERIKAKKDTSILKQILFLPISVSKVLCDSIEGACKGLVDGAVNSMEEVTATRKRVIKLLKESGRLKNREEELQCEKIVNSLSAPLFLVAPIFGGLAGVINGARQGASGGQ